jgi:hypothetical protein
MSYWRLSAWYFRSFAFFGAFSLARARSVYPVGKFRNVPRRLRASPDIARNAGF